MGKIFGANKPETKNSYDIRFIGNGMEYPGEYELRSLSESKKVAHKLYKRGYHGEIFKVLRKNTSYGWFYEDSDIVHTF